jgi:hypothetical protein
MPVLDLYHNAVKQALIKDGWMITHDPLHLRWGRKDMYVDLGAKRLILAERLEEKSPWKSKVLDLHDFV